MPSLSDLSIKQLDALVCLPDDFSLAKDGRYVIKHTDSIDQVAHGPEVETKLWFQTKVSSSCRSLALDLLLTTHQPLHETEIRRIRRLKLYTESHDQGYTSDPDSGNWTWFEYVIVEGPSRHAKIQDGIKLVWTSHMNLREDTEEYAWVR
jgi:hypothetical protein